jgi:hypothetical protein
MENEKHEMGSAFGILYFSCFIFHSRLIVGTLRAAGLLQSRPQPDHLNPWRTRTA